MCQIIFGQCLFLTLLGILDKDRRECSGVAVSQYVILQITNQPVLGPSG